MDVRSGLCENIAAPKSVRVDSVTYDFIEIHDSFKANVT